jgi:methionine sulfoxide reductase heme-binding subunit
MARLTSNWRWATFNVAALFVFAFVITASKLPEALFVDQLCCVLTQGSTDWQETETFDPGLESGKWGIRFLLICLTMTPLHTFLRWSSALKLRKSAGLWAFGFGALHLLQYAIETWEPNRAWRVNGIPWQWLAWPIQLYIALGLVSITILAALAMTSNRWSMRRLGKRWKRLHRLVYGAGMAVIAHALLAGSMSKKMMVRDPEAVSELRVYLGVLVVLLVVRIPQVRSLLLQMMASLRSQARTVEPVAPRVIPSRTIPQSPKLPRAVPLPKHAPDEAAPSLRERAPREREKVI